MKSSAGLFLDLDGTLADSLGVMRAVYERFLTRWSCTASNEEFNSLNGPPLPEVVQRLKDSHGLKSSTNDLLQTYRDFIDEAYEHVKPNQGAIDLIHTANTENWTVCVVTSNGKALATTWLERVGLIDFVDVIISGDEVKVGKPDPEPYLIALQKTKCLANSSLAVEDSPQGVQSSLQAGLKTFALGANKGEWPLGALPISDLRSIIPYVKGEGMFNVSLLSKDTIVRLEGDAVSVSTEIEHEIEKIWQHEKKSRPVFEGTIFSLRDDVKGDLVGHAVPYKWWVAQQLKPHLFSLLGIRPLAITGILRCADGIVFGHRSKYVNQDVGLWELAPAGGIDVEHHCLGDEIDLREQLQKELCEELGLLAQDISLSSLFCLVDDVHTHVLDIAILMHSPLDAGAIKDAFHNVESQEYDDVKIVPESDLADFVENENVANVSKMIIKFWKDHA